MYTYIVVVDDAILFHSLTLAHTLRMHFRPYILILIESYNIAHNAWNPKIQFGFDSGANSNINERLNTFQPFIHPLEQSTVN